MFKRRHFLKYSLILGTGVNAGCDLSGSGSGSAPAAEGFSSRSGTTDEFGTGFRMPAESSRHDRTWMQWPPYPKQYGDDHEYFLLVRQDIVRLARAIAEFEEVFMLARPEQVAQARDLCGPTVTVHAMAVDNMWARDSGPTFIVGRQGGTAIMDFHFNGWGDKEPHGNDARIAASVGLMQSIPVLQSDLTCEGGAIDVDGEGTMLTTESSIININRNPGLSKVQLEIRLNVALGTSKIIWLPGFADGKDITDGHIDGLARFIKPGLVLVELLPMGDVGKEARMAEAAVTQLKDSTDAVGRKLKVLTIRRPLTTRTPMRTAELYQGYLNYYLCNGALIMPEFGDAHYDEAAAQTLAGLYPERKIVKVNVDRICENGGGIHCVTQQQPSAL